MKNNVLNNSKVFISKVLLIIGARNYCIKRVDGLTQTYGLYEIQVSINY